MPKVIRISRLLTCLAPREARTQIARLQSHETPLGAFSIFLDFNLSQDENPARLPSLQKRTSFGSVMYQPPPLHRSVFDDKTVLLIDPHQCTRDVRASVLRSRGIEVDATDLSQVLSQKEMDIGTKMEIPVYVRMIR